MALTEGKRSRTYTEAERMGLMFASLNQGVQAVADAAGVPDRTIYQWFEDAGGLAQVRNFAKAAADRAVSDAKRTIAETVIRFLGENMVEAPQVIEAFVRIYEAESKGIAKDAPAVAITNVQAAQEYTINPEALARAMLTLQQAGASNGHTVELLNEG